MRALSFDRESLHAHYRAGGRPEAVVAEAHRRLAAAADAGIFIDLVPQFEAEAAARALPPFDPAAFPLWGLPFAIKDNIDLAGRPTTAACPAFAYDAAADAKVVALLKAAGAVPIGKTNLDQFATGLVGLRSPYPPPRNAIDPAIPPGGSSSGSAVAVARGIVTFALGTDTAGSGRVPAALNNIVGLKPSLGAVSTTGVVPACRTLDCVSVFALTVPDAWAVFSAAARHDPADPYSRRRPATGFGEAPSRFRIGAPSAATRRFAGDAAQAASFEAALARLAGLGGEIVEIDFAPFYEIAALLYEGAWVAERLAAVEPLLARDPDAFHPVTRRIIGGAAKLTAVDAFRGFYRLAALRRVVEPVIGGVDLIAVPTIPAFRTVADFEADPIGPNSEFGTYTNFVNLLDLCAVAAPVGPRPDGRPGSVTLLAPGGRDGLAASVAAALHRAAAPRLGATEVSPPPLVHATAEPAPDETALFVVGAHMRGMALESQMRAAGARFLAAASTARAYRLHALPMSPPRPGMVRVGAGGASIAGELWAIPTAALGGFLAAVPAPLGLGRVTLSDGAEPLGFLAEAAAAEGAEDISSFGGWRAWMARGAA